jgi:membrane protease YdiL (CAAX protease family)
VDAAEVLSTGVGRRIDLGRVGGRHFVAVSSVGLDAEIARAMNEDFRYLKGMAAYVWATLTTIFRFAPAPFRLELDGEVIHLPAMLVAVANGRFYGGGMKIAPEAALADGLFDVVILGALAYVLSRQGRGIRSIGIGFRWGDPFRAVGLAVLAALAVTLLHLAVRALGHAFGVAPDLRHVADAGWKERSISELIHDISSPIYEEVLVRGYLMSEMIALGKPAGAAIVASVLLQSSYHLYYGIGTAVSLSGEFIVFAIYFASSRKLMPVLLAHLYWDLFVYFRH